MENETKKKTWWRKWNKYILYGVIIMLTIITSIKVKEVEAVNSQPIFIQRNFTIYYNTSAAPGYVFTIYNLSNTNMNLPPTGAQGRNGFNFTMCASVNLSQSDNIRCATGTNVLNQEPWIRINFTIQEAINNQFSNITSVRIVEEASTQNSSLNEAAMFLHYNWSTNTWNNFSQPAQTEYIANVTYYSQHDIVDVISNVTNQTVLLITAQNIDPGELLLVDFVQVVINMTNYTIDYAPNITQGYPQINTTQGRNITNEPVTVSWVGTDEDVEHRTLKYNITWYQNNVSNFTFGNFLYSNGTMITNTFNVQNITTNGSTWKAMITLYDNYTQTYFNTSELLIIADSNGTTRYATNFSNNVLVGTQIWINPSLSNASDDVYTTVGLSVAQQSNYLMLGNFTFNVPSNAKNIFVQAQIERKAAGLSDISDAAVRLVKDGLIGSADRSAAGTWGTTDTVITYGSNRTDSWGFYLNSTGINNHTFGLAISVSDVLALDTASIDNVNLTVFYETTLAASNSCTYTSGTWNINWYDNCTIISQTNLLGNNIIIDGRNGCGTFSLKDNLIHVQNISRWLHPIQQYCTIARLGGNISR